MPDRDDRGDEDREDEQHDGGHGPSGPVLLIAAAIVVAVGLFLSARIRDFSRIQDCILAGHTNCAPIEDEGR